MVRKTLVIILFLYSSISLAEEDLTIITRCGKDLALMYGKQGTIKQNGKIVPTVNAVIWDIQDKPILVSELSDRYNIKEIKLKCGAF